MSIDPMQSAHDAPRCKAKSKRTGLACRSPAVNGYQVCRMHGARGGAPEGKRNGNFRHGVRGKSSKHRVSSRRWPVLWEAVRTDSGSSDGLSPVASRRLGVGGSLSCLRCRHCRESMIGGRARFLRMRALPLSAPFGALSRASFSSPLKTDSI